MSDNNGTEGLSIEQLAAQMLGLESEDDSQYDEGQEEAQEVERPAGHPAWQEILDQIPAELHDKVIPTLQNWDAGVSRRFQKIHDEYAPYKDLEVDPDDIKEAMDVYSALTSDPRATWEAIGRVYGLSPQGSPAEASEEDDFDYDELPASVRKKLSQLDEHDMVLKGMAAQLQAQKEAEEEAEEDAALEEYLEELHEEYGEFDDDYIIGLIASGVDGDEAVERFQSLVNQFAPKQDTSRNTPRVMSSGGGVPTGEAINVTGMSNQDTQSLVAEILRLSQNS